MEFKLALVLVLLVVALALQPLAEGRKRPAGGVDSSSDAEDRRASNWLPAVSDRLLELLDIRIENGTYLLPKLLYDYDGLEPYMSERTVRVHHTGHHAAYTNRLNSILSHMTPAGSDESERNVVEHLLHLGDIIEDFQELFRNHGGGYVNHAFTFYVMGPVDQTSEGPLGPSGKVLELMEAAFGTAHAAIEQFSNHGVRLFGSGYVWLCLDKRPGSDSLHLVYTVNQVSPLSQGYRPILGIDVWEHAYYLQYQNMRADYVSSWWSLVAWDKVNLLLDAWLQADPAYGKASTHAEGTASKTEL